MCVGVEEIGIYMYLCDMCNVVYIDALCARDCGLCVCVCVHLSVCVFPLLVVSVRMPAGVPGHTH